MNPRQRGNEFSAAVLAAVLGLALGTALAVPKLIVPKGVVLYVSTEGDDAWSGLRMAPRSDRRDGPLLTIEGARDRIRMLRHQHELDKPVVVYVRGGVYELKAPVVFTAEDSGGPEKPVCYENYPAEAPVLSGGRQIHGNKPAFKSDEAGGASVNPISGEADQLDSWVVLPVESEEVKRNFHSLFAGGERRERARSPNHGFYHVDGLISADKPARFKYRGDDIRASWAARGDVEVVALLKWAEFRMPIREVGEASHTVTLSGQRQDFGDEKDIRYWIENAPEAFDAPGEWFLDRERNTLQYKPLPGEDIRTTPMVAPALTQLVLFEGGARPEEAVHDVTLRGLTFAYTDWSMPPAGYSDMQAAYDLPAAVELKGTRHCSIEKCLFTHLGQYALEVHRGSTEVRVAGNTMTDLGAGGVKIGDPELPASPGALTSGIEASGNIIRDIGKVFPAAVGVWIGQSSGNKVSHNEIGDTYYTGISAGWTWGYGATAARDNLIEFNHIHGIGRGMLSDMGCIYTLGVQPGTVERGNFCHDVTRYVHGYGGWGIYTDEGSSDILIEDNLVVRAEDGGFHQHYGRENIVRNNIFAFGQTAQIRRTRKEAHLSFAFERNIVDWTGGPLLDGEWSDGNFRFDSNVYFRTDGAAIRFGGLSWDEWRRSQDAHSIIADPLFADPLAGDFSLLPGSPALKLGFAPFDASRAGPDSAGSE